MNYLQNFISEEMIHALGWTVLHSLWQAFVVALLLAFAMLGLQKQSAQVRYTVAYVALLITFGLTIVTFYKFYNNTIYHFSGDVNIFVEESGAFIVDVPYSSEEFLQRFSNYFNEHIPLIVTVWLLGVAFFVLRLLGGLAYIQHLKTAYTSPIPEKWQYLLEDLAAQIPVKRSVELLESALIKVPMVIGHFKPVILLPVGAVNGLSTAQVEAILAHELAHIARHDYLLHILQSVIEIFFYFNPAVWWISALIRTERENCCDDTAVALCGNQLTYAKALVALQEMSIATPNLAMTFANNKNQLLKRIQRILNQPQNKSDIMEKLTATCLLLAILVGLSVSAARPYNHFTESPDFSSEPATELDSEPIIIMNMDTLPKGNKNGSFSYDDGEKQIEAKIKNNKIVELRIDGEEIPASEIGNYEAMVEEMMANVPEPPLPAIAPFAPSMIDMPPTPPTAPTPSVWNHNGNSKVTKQKDKNGNTIITIEQGNGEAATIEVGKDGKLLLNGKELKDGEEAAIFNNAFLEHMEGFDEEAWQMQEAQIAKAEAGWAKQEEAFRKQEEAWRKNEEKWREQEKAFEKQAADQERYARAFAFSGEHPNWNGVGTYVYEAVGNDNIRKTLEKELRKDGLIKSVDSYKLEITKQNVKVNGKELPEASAKKYIELYEKEANFKMKNNSEYKVSRKAEE